MWFSNHHLLGILGYIKWGVIGIATFFGIGATIFLILNG